MTSRLWRQCELFPHWRDGERERWEELSRQGKTRFVIKNGVIFWSSWCLLLALMPLLFDPLGAQSLPLKTALLGLVVWSAGGTLWWALVWEGTSRSYSRYFGPRAE